ncbi:MAG: PAS domain S-box protein [Candidatus Binatia bacterium]
MIQEKTLEEAKPVSDLDNLTKANQALQAEIARRELAEDETRLILEILQAIGEARDFQSALEVALRKVCEFTGWQLGLARVRSDDGNRLVVHADWHAAGANLAEFVSSCRAYSFALDEGIPGRVWASRQPLWVPNLSDQSTDLYPLVLLAMKVGFSAVAAVPVFENGEVVAVLVFSTFAPREKDNRQLAIIAAAAAHLGFALHRKRTEEELRKSEALLRQSREELEIRVQERTLELAGANRGLEIEIAERRRIEEEISARVRQQAVVSQIGQRALRGGDLSLLFTEICPLVVGTLGVEFCKVLELLPDGQAFRLRAGVGWRKGLVGEAMVNAGTHSQAGYTLLSNRPVIVEDLRTERRFKGPPLLLEHGIVSGMSVIISGPARPFGILAAHARTRRSFRTEDVYFLEAVANVLSAAIERRTAEEKIERDEFWLRSLIATTQDAVLSIDRRGCVVLFNPSAERIFGYAAQEVIGHKVNELMAEPYASEHDEYIARYERTGEARAIGRIRTVTAKRKDGEVFPIELSVAEIEVDQEIHYAAFIRDISEKTKLQEQLVERERLATIGTTAAKIGHELANPLNGMSLTIQLLEQRLGRQPSSPDSQVTATVQRLKNEIARLNQLVAQFRTISRRERYDFQPTQLADLIADVVTIQRPHFAQLSIEVEQHIPADLPSLVVDSDKIKQALLNLIKNAAEAMPGGGKVIIDAHATETGIVIDITDTGPGIPLDVDAFEPFTTTKKNGTGIGLVIVRQIVTAHGGRVSYHSRNGEGTTFRVELPQR